VLALDRRPAAGTTYRVEKVRPKVGGPGAQQSGKTGVSDKRAARACCVAIPEEARDMSRFRIYALVAGLALVAGGLILSPAHALPGADPLASLKAACVNRDAADNNTANGLQLPYRFCDDGVPPVGGRTPNVGAVSAVAVPQKYAGFAGLPAKIAPDPNAGADADGNIALDVDISMPDPALTPAPTNGYPILAMMHGCCAGNKTSWESATIDGAGELWHYNNAWYASHGYIVITYTARGFVDANNRGSTGETQLDSRSYEINDFQYLAGLIGDDSGFFHSNRMSVATTGGSYGGGFSWMALTDPTWNSPGGKKMALAAVAPRYGWTDLVQSLVPTGRHFRDALPATDGSASTAPLGFPKRSIVGALYASGTTGIPPSFTHTTFPSYVDDAFACLNSSDPYETNPLCTSTIATTLPSFINDRSPYYQNGFFSALAGGTVAPVPVFSAGTFSDPLFPSVEHRRMVERLKSVIPSYPVQEYYGDYEHFVQNKAKEWGDVCGADHHVCVYADYPGGNLNGAPTGLVSTGVTTRINRFLDHYLAPANNQTEPTPAFDVTASLQVCPQNAGPGQPADEPGPRFTASTFDALAPNTLTVTTLGTSTHTTNNVEPNPHAANSDPLVMLANSGHCPEENANAGTGVATYITSGLPTEATMLGRTRVIAVHTGTGDGIQLNARLYDVFPDGTRVMVDRGFRRVEGPNQTTTFDLNGNGWKFPAGHAILIELMQDDDPYIKNSNQPSSLTISTITLLIPIREASTSIGGAPILP
jgi:hypothetical protein